MKKIFFVGILSILCVSAAFAQVRFGVTAGLNTSKSNESGTGLAGQIINATEYSFKAGFQAGILADIGITESFSVIPELLFSQRGGKEKFSLLGESLSASGTLNYLQLPVNCAYKFDVGMGSKFLVFAGPYVGYGLSAKIKYNNVPSGFDIDELGDVKFGSGDNELKPLDFGISGGIGFEYDKIFFKLQYNHGLSNLSNDKDITSKNVNIGLTTGYFF